MDIVASFVAGGQAAELEDPGDRPFGDPAVATEPLLRLDALAGDPVEDAPLLEVGVAAWDVVGLVGVQLARSDPWTPARTLDRLDQLDDCLEQGAVMVVGGGVPSAQRDAVAVDQEVVLRAGLAPIGRVRPGFGPPFLARRLAESRLARLQSIRSACPSRSSRTVCRRCHTLARFQSRSRRQQVMPAPQPSSRGSHSQGRPVFSTNRIPVRAARSETLGRPPLGLGGSFGSSGWTISHSSSDTNGLLMPARTFKIRASGAGIVRHS